MTIFNGFEDDFLADRAYDCKKLRAFLQRKSLNNSDEKKYRQRDVGEGAFSALKRKKIKMLEAC